MLGEVRANGVVHNARSTYESGDASLVSEGRRATVIPVGLMGDCEEGAGRLMEVVAAADRGAFDVTITGECSADRDLNQILADDLKTGELYFGIPAALVILVLVFGAVVAAVVPLVIAVFSIVIALALSALIGQGFDLSTYILNMTTVMGLAIATDYALFIVSRYRDERAAVGSSSTRSRCPGRRRAGPSCSAASRSCSPCRACCWSRHRAARSRRQRDRRGIRLGAGGAHTRAGVAWRPRRSRQRAPHPLPRPGCRLGRQGRPFLVADRPRRDAAAGGQPRRLGGLAPGSGGAGHRPSALRPRAALLPRRSPLEEGFLALEEEFGVGTVDSAIVVVEGDVAAPALRTAVARLVQRLEESPSFRDPEVDVSPDQRLAVIEALVTGDSRDQRAIAAVKSLRNRDVPAVFDGVEAVVLVTGETAEEIDYTALTDVWLPRVIIFVLALSFVLLTIAFRSVVLPLKAILLNLLSVGAAYGLMVLVFQKGVGNELFGLRETQAVTTWVPLFLFAVLFGLSMDYHVFLLSRIRERYLRTGDNEEAVTYAVATTARVITGAALIIIAVFAGFASGDLVETQQVGFGVGIALLIDATIVRCVLVPSSMKLLGRWNWYLPAWLRWLPDPHVEHESS